MVGPPGTIIRQEPLQGAPEGAAAYRVLYRSTGLDGRPIAVSGVIIIPAGPVPLGGRPIVAWAHPTSGVVPRCAPSLALFLFQQIQGLREMVRRGFVVAATDYPGLGTPDHTPISLGSVKLDRCSNSVRVASVMPGAGGGHRFAVWGHSQGGQRHCIRACWLGAMRRIFIWSALRRPHPQPTSRSSSTMTSTVPVAKASSR